MISIASLPSGGNATNWMQFTVAAWSVINVLYTISTANLPSDGSARNYCIDSISFFGALHIIYYA